MQEKVEEIMKKKSKMGSLFRKKTELTKQLRNINQELKSIKAMENHRCRRIHPNYNIRSPIYDIKSHSKSNKMILPYLEMKKEDKIRRS